MRFARASIGYRLLLQSSVLLVLVFALSAADETNEGGKKNSRPKKSSKVISLAESIHRSQKNIQNPERINASRKQWERALKEIKELTSINSKQRNGTRGKDSFNQWKLLLDQPSKVELDPETNFATAQVEIDAPSSEPGRRKRKMARFEGFASWERLLQDWADDIQEYMDKIESESTEYPFSTYGTPKKDLAWSNDQASSNVDDVATGIPINETKVEDTQVVNENLKKKKSISLPVPAAAKDGEEVLPHTDIADKSKSIWIVTTAALPWMTGTAVNPLLRAAYMTEGRSEAGGSVTLMLPWLERRKDRLFVYGDKQDFANFEEQESYIRTWLREKAKLPEASEKLRIEWYTAWRNAAENSLYSMGDITALIPAEQVDICILEEPEHLNWYRAPGEAWTDKFKHVVGIIHTNYFVYAQEQPAAFIRAPGMRLLCSWMCRSHCHRVIKLSGTLGRFSPEKELVENVHGVRASFLGIGEEVKKRLQSPTAVNDPIFGSEAEPSIYFIGKMLWSKGLGSLMELVKYAEESAGIKVHIDMYGGGPDKDAAEARAESLGVDLEFHGPIDHPELGLSHKIFFNPSTSEVLCTTVAEALAMGKFVVVPSHPSNDFFAQFPNCLTYTNKEEFVGNLYYALTHSPAPLTKDDAYTLSWEAATERLEAAGSIPVKEAEMMANALSSRDAGIEISLPPLIEDDQTRKSLANTLQKTRNRYRQFRSQLSQEIQQNTNVLPNGVKERLVQELDKRLDLDIDNVIASPKLRLQLSPAELDKRLLELYKFIQTGPRGDVLRIIGGGQEVALQDFYIKTHTRREGSRSTLNQSSSFGPFETLGDESDTGKLTASQWVNLALRKNLPNSSSSNLRSDQKGQQARSAPRPKNQKMEMALSCSSTQTCRYPTITPRIPFTTANHFCPPRKSSSSLSLLI